MTVASCVKYRCSRASIYLTDLVGTYVFLAPDMLYMSIISRLVEGC